MNVRRDRGVALPSPVAALSVLAIVVAVIALAVTSFGGSTTKQIPNAAITKSATPSVTTSATASTKPTSTPRPPAFTMADKSSIHVSVWNATSTPGLAEKVGQKAKAAGWTNLGTGTTLRTYAATIIYYPHTGDAAKWKAAAQQLGLDLGITNLSEGDAGTPQDRLMLVVLGPLA